MKKKALIIGISIFVVVLAVTTVWFFLSKNGKVEVWRNGVLTDFVNTEKKEVRYQSKTGMKSISLSKVNMNGGDTIIDTMEGPLSASVISSDDGSRCALYSDTGIQTIHVNDFSLSALFDEALINRYKHSDNPKKVVWQNADSPKFSYDNSKILFATIQNQEYSIWVYDFNAKKVSEITRGKKKEYLNLVGWVDNDRFIYRNTSHTEKSVQYYICNLQGQSRKIDITGKDICILGMFEGGYIVYIPDYALSDSIVVANITDDSLKIVAQSAVAGVYRDEVSFSKSANRIAIPYKPTESPLEQMFTVVNLSTGGLENIRVPVDNPENLKMVFQADGNDLLIYNINQGIGKETVCWKYNLPEGAK